MHSSFDLEIICSHENLALFQDDDLHLVTGNRINTYCLNKSTCQEKSKEIKPGTLSVANSKMFYFNKITLLIGKPNQEIWRLSLYQLETKATSTSWEPVALFRPSISKTQFDLESCIPVSYKDDIHMLTLVSVVANRILFHVFSLKVSDKNKKVASSILHNGNLRLTSCVVLSNDIFCCLFLPKMGSSYVYKFDFVLIQQHRKEANTVSPVCIWPLNFSTLQNCFLSIHKNIVTVISFNKVDDGTNMEIRKLLTNPMKVLPPELKLKSETKSITASEVSSAELTCKFTNVRIIAASFVPSFQNYVIAVMYCNNKTNKYYIQRVS